MGIEIYLSFYSSGARFCHPHPPSPSLRPPIMLHLHFISGGNGTQNYHCHLTYVSPVFASGYS